MRKFYDIILGGGGGYDEEDFIPGDVIPSEPQMIREDRWKPSNKGWKEVIERNKTGHIKKEYKILKRLKKVGMYILMLLWALVGVFGLIVGFLPIFLIWLITGFSVIKWYGNLGEKWFPDESFKE